MAKVGTVWLDVALDAQKSGQDLERFGKTFTANVSAPLGGLEALAVRGFSAFESSLARVSGLSGVARSQVQAWTEDVKNIGVQYGVGAQSAADALYFVTSSGIQTSAALDVVAESSKASAAGLGETQTVADLTTSALNAYKGTGLDAARATDILTAAVAAGKGEPAEFAQSLGQVLPIASALGVSYDQVAGAEAAMTLRGLDASEATTALRGIFTTLLKPTTQADQALAGVGLSSEGLRRQLKEQGLLATLETLTSSLGDDAAATAAVFDNVRALNGVMNILGENTSDTRRVMDEVANSTGATDKAFESAAQTTEFKLNQALARTKVALIDVGGQIAPVASGVAGFASGVAEQFGRLPQPIQTGAVAVGLFLTSVGPATFVLGKLTAGFGASAIAARDFAVGVSTANAANTTTGIGRLGAALGNIPFRAAAATSGVIALAGGYAILQSKINQGIDDGQKLRKIGDSAVSNAQSFKDLQDFIGKANQQTEELSKRFGDIKFDPSEREQIGALGEALAGSAEQAAKFSGQAIRISDAMGVSRDEATKFVLEQNRLGNTFKDGDTALAAYQQHLSEIDTKSTSAASATSRFAAAANGLSDPFFAALSAQRSFETAVRGVADAQRQADAANRAVDDAIANHEQALRRVSDAEDRHRQSLRAVADAQRGVIEAQQALNDALRGPSTDQQLNVDSAQLAVERAQQRIRDLGKTTPGQRPQPVDPLDRREADLNLRRAQNDLGRAQAEIAGRVEKAQNNLRDAQDRLTDAQRSARDAAQAVADAHNNVGRSMQAVTDARQGAEDATNAVRDAQWQANDAARALAGAQDAFNAALSKGPNLAAPFIEYLVSLRDRFPEVAGSMQSVIDQFNALNAAARNPYAGLDTSTQRAPLDQPVGGDSARAFGGPVSAGERYTVTERGAPELFTDGRTQWMIPPVAGQVAPLQVAEFDPAQAMKSHAGVQIGAIHLNGVRDAKDGAWWLRHELRKREHLAAGA